MNLFSEDKRLLAQAKDRITFMYIEYARLEQTDYSVAMIQGDRSIEIPVTTIGAIFLGPGTTVTHSAMKNLAAAGVSVIWCGSEEWRMYVAGAPATNSSKNILLQMRCHESKTKRMAIVKKMYEIRYPDEHFSRKTIAEMRGLEGVRVRQLYNDLSDKYKVLWNGRHLNIGEFETLDDVNKALTIGNQILYGTIRGVLHLLGFSSAIGFIHTGHMLSFVYDIADLYKERLSIPLAFGCAAEEPADIGKWMRTNMRKNMTEMKFMSQVVKDLRIIFENEDCDIPDIELALWDCNGYVSANRNYG